MKALLDAEKLKLGVHIRKMNSPGTPVYRYGENLWPAGTVLLASLLATRLVHFYLGAVVLAAGMYWWIAKVMPKVREGVHDRTAALVLQDERMFDALWIKGALSLHATLPDGTEQMATRRTDWRSFINALPGDL